MDGLWKNESHSLSQSNTSNLLEGNGLKEEGSCVWNRISFFLILI